MFQLQNLKKKDFSTISSKTRKPKKFHFEMCFVAPE